MSLSSNYRLHELEERFSALEGEIKDSPEKQAISILHAMIQESRRSAAPAGFPAERDDGVTLETIANL